VQCSAEQCSAVPVCPVGSGECIAIPRPYHKTTLSQLSYNKFQVLQKIQLLLGLKNAHILHKNMTTLSKSLT
jgi:hypothetical protein